jgi:hypothetical protein
MNEKIVGFFAPDSVPSLRLYEVAAVCIIAALVW